MSDDRVLSYLSGELDEPARRAFEAELARDPALQAELEAWRQIAQARQLAHNEIGQSQRDTAFLRALAEHDQDASAAPAERQVAAHPPAAQADRLQPPPAPAAPADRPQATPASRAKQPHDTPAPTSRARRLWQWLWPTPASPLMPLGWALALMLSVMVAQQAPVGAPDAPDTVLTRGGGVCPRLVVDLPDALTARQLRNTLSQYAVSIVDGPDADGRYVLAAARESSLRDAATALGALSAAAAPAGVCPTP